MEIGPLANQRIVAVGPRHTLDDAARRMHERGVGSAVVETEDGSPGIITERDLLRAIAQGADLTTAPVDEFMTANAITASPTWDVKAAARRMLDGGFRHLIVLDQRGRPAGILSLRDLAKVLLDAIE